MKLKLISDGTCVGTKLIDEDSQKMIHLIQHINWKATAGNYITNMSVDMVCIPIDIIAKAEICECTLNGDKQNVYEKEVRIVTETPEVECNKFTYGSTDLLVYDNVTHEPISCISDLSIDITKGSVTVKIKKIKFDSKVNYSFTKLDPIDVREFGNVLTDMFTQDRK